MAPSTAACRSAAIVEARAAGVQVTMDLIYDATFGTAIEFVCTNGLVGL